MNHIHIGIDPSKKMTGLVAAEDDLRIFRAGTIAEFTDMHAYCRSVHDWIAESCGEAVILHIHIEDWARKFGRGPGAVPINPFHVEIVSALEQHLSVRSPLARITKIAPDKAKRVVGIEVSTLVPYMKRMGWGPDKRTRELKDRTLAMVCRITNLGDFLDGCTKPEQRAQGDATAVAIAGIGEAKKQRLREMAR